MSSSHLFLHSRHHVRRAWYEACVRKRGKIMGRRLARTQAAERPFMVIDYGFKITYQEAGTLDPRGATIPRAILS